MDKKYWDKYYLNHGKDVEIASPSTFASFCQQLFFSENYKNIVELGCGNGRDAIFFTKQGHNVYAMDQCTLAVELMANNLSNNFANNLTPVKSDFIKYNYNNIDDVDVFYSRFTMHSITLDDEHKLIKKVCDRLGENGLFCVEARTIRDPLYEVGEYISDTTYKTDHLRRFINSNNFLQKLIDLGFSLKYFHESDGLSIYGNDDPVLMRIVAIKGYG